MQTILKNAFWMVGEKPAFDFLANIPHYLKEFLKGSHIQRQRQRQKNEHGTHTNIPIYQTEEKRFTHNEESFFMNFYRAESQC